NLETIWVASYKLRFDKAKRRNEEMRRHGSNQQTRVISQTEDTNRFRSYKDALVSGNPVVASIQRSMRSLSSDRKSSILELSVPEE
ncbi:hypothetical protein Ancab_036439, partial [Ancistrocladus abbreviatus]